MAATLCGRAYGYTRFSNEPGSCKVIGDGDVYGIGVRISFYLCLLSVSLAAIFRLHDALQTTKATVLILLVANLININIDSTRPGALVAYELSLTNILVLLPTMASILTTFCRQPDRPESHQEENERLPQQAVAQPLGPQRWDEVDLVGPSTLIVLTAYLSSMAVAHCQDPLRGRKGDCVLWVLYLGFGDRVDFYVYYPDYRLRAAPIYLIPLVLCVILFIPSVWDVGSGILYMTGFIPDNRATLTDRLVRWMKKHISLLGKKVFSLGNHESCVAHFVLGFQLLNLLLGVLLVYRMEKILAVSEIDLGGTSISSPGQLFPLIAGVFGVVVVVWALALKIIWKRKNRTRGLGATG
ncbi:hypothetical protein B0T10DRAFT_553776 [Thelonectria olida]|uniref:Uncharacterized protein n=1 Tax=Thelonectria olida TaxID=1576542 RepID=A0A9P8VRS7_9HYPO|nr:hypothetical protein B0T10DRAFT_553776 [Thelonectria olida]